MNKILVVEKTPELAFDLLGDLQSYPCSVHSVSDFNALFASCKWQQFDVIIIDVNNSESEMQLCKTIKNNCTSPKVLAIFETDVSASIVNNIGVYFDDYLINPVDGRDLLARVRALLNKNDFVMDNGDLEFGEFTIDQKARRLLTGNNKNIHLTRTEYKLLLYFVENQNHALSRDDILAAVWGNRVNVGERTVDNFVSNINKKLSTHAQSHSIPKICNVWGVGYRMEFLQSVPPMMIEPHMAFNQ